MWHLATAGAIFTVGLARRKRGDGVWHSVEPFCGTNLLHHQLSPHHQQGLCAGAKPVWCRQSPPANKSWHLELVRRSAGQGLSNFKIGIWLEQQRKLPVGRRDRRMWSKRRPVMLMLARSSVISGVTWWQVVFLMTWLHKDLPPASQPAPSAPRPQRRASSRRPGTHLKIARCCSLIACH